MNIKLSDICYARSGDKGRNSNIGLIFTHSMINALFKSVINKIVKMLQCNERAIQICKT